MKPVKKVRLPNRDDNPPTRRWLIRQERLRLWNSLNGLNGTSTGSQVLDESLRREFGGYSNDPMARQFHVRSGEVVAAPAEPVAVELPDVEPVEPFDALKYAQEPPKWA
jgi:hypothetical protein